MLKKLFLGIICSFMFVPIVSAQVGIFDETAEIGLEDNAFIPPNVAFDSGTYTMDGLGASIGRETLRDEFVFLYSQVSGSFAIEGDIYPNFGIGKGGLMIRQDLDVDSVHASYLRASDTIPGSNTGAAFGSMFPFFRTVKGSGTNVDGDFGDGFSDDNIGPVRLERIGNSIHFYTQNNAGEWNYVQTEVVPMSDSVYTGLAATAETPDDFGEFEFYDVAITPLPLWVGRTLSVDTWTPGASVDVTVTARANELVDATINELTPVGTTISNVQVSAGDMSFKANGTVDWTLPQFDGEATLTYTATLGDGISGAWTGLFNDGINRESHIGGDAILPKNPAIVPAAGPFVVSPGGVTFMEAETATVLDDDTGLLIQADPRASGGLGLILIANRGSLEFELDVQQAGTYYIAASGRGEDGNSDSFYVGIDFLERTHDYGFALANNRAFTPRWMENFPEGANFWDRIVGDHREWDMPVGTSYLVIQERESSAKLDWIAIVDDPELEIGLFGTPKQGEKFVSNVANPTPVPLVDGSAMIEAEDAVLIKSAFTGQFGLRYNRNASGELIVNAEVTNGSTVDLDNHLDFWFDVAEAGTYRIIARVRFPNGNDDSFWVQMDNEPPIADNSADRFTGGAGSNSFFTRWVGTDLEPDIAWDLDPGPHVFNLYTREDGTQIDWIYVTNDLSIDPATFDPTGEPGVSVDDYMLHQ